MTRRSLSSLTDNKLLSDLLGLVKKEKRTTLSILLHLAEVDRRELYLPYGFSSLYDYCVGALNYSRSAAGRRITTARCIRRYPEIYDLLDSDEVSLSTIGLIAPILDDNNKDLLLREIRNKTHRQVETIVAAFKPAIAYRDRVKPVRVAVLDVGQNAKNSRNSLIFNSRHGSNPIGENLGATGGAGSCSLGSSAASKPRGTDSTARRAASHSPISAGSSEDDRSRPAAAPPAATEVHNTTTRATRTERRLLVQFLASEEFMAKLDEVKSLLSNKMPGGTFEEVFEALIDEFLERHGPVKRQQRRNKRQKRPTVQQKSPNNSKRTKQERTSKPAPKKPVAHLLGRTRHIPAAIRDKVYVRDTGRCSYVGKNGKRCGSTSNLQIDHIKPVARGGTNTLRNLRLLCGKHNRLEAKRVLGTDVMNRCSRRE